MKREKGIRIILAILGIILVGTGVAFNAAAALGNDPVGIVYDGIRSALNLSSEQLGMASNIVNIVLVVIIFFWGKTLCKYWNIYLYYSIWVRCRSGWKIISHVV